MYLNQEINEDMFVRTVSRFWWTRAKRSVTLIAERRRESPFVLELMQDGHVGVAHDDDGAVVLVCDACEKATMVLRTGKYGEFYGCGRYPLCKNTQKAGSNGSG